MTVGSKPQREKVESLIDVIESEGWLVENYHADVDPFKPRIDIKINAEYRGGDDE